MQHLGDQRLSPLANYPRALTAREAKDIRLHVTGGLDSRERAPGLSRARPAAIRPESWPSTQLTGR
jgi:hypothetical protein